MRMTFTLLIAIVLAAPAAAQAHSISLEADAYMHMSPTGYEPKDITIEQGQTVAFENISDVDLWPASNIHPTHEIYSEFDPKHPIPPGETWTFTFNRVGQWKYHDHLYPQTVGTITVRGTGQPEEGKPSLFNRVRTSLQKLVSWAIALVTGKKTAPETQETTWQPPERVYDDTITADDEEVFRNYDRLYSYVRKFGPAETMVHLDELSSRLSSCHDAAHRVGRFAYELYGDDAFIQCTPQCHSGCYHGATELYFKVHGTNDLAEALKVICNSDLNPFFSHQCFHGIGHGLMAWANYDIIEALKSCDLLEAPTARESCYSGVYMENIVGTLGDGAADGHYTNYLNSDPHFPCNIVDDKYKTACYFYQTSRMVTLFDGDFAKVAAACLEAPPQYQWYCFGSMGRDVGGVHRGNPQGAIAACQNAPAGNDRLGCLNGAVQDTFWEPTGQDEALGFCRLLTVPSEKDSCYSTIFDRAPQILDSPEAVRTFCAKAESKYREQCLEHIPSEEEQHYF